MRQGESHTLCNPTILTRVKVTVSRFILSCTTCALRAPGKDELLETLKHAPVAGFKYWGVAGPPFWTPGVPQWIDADKINKLARDAGLEGMTEVYAAGIVTDSPQAAEAYPYLKHLILEVTGQVAE